MAHAHHFLGRLDRISREHTEYALGLYRDHEAVKYVLDHVRLPVDAPRVALAIGSPDDGPFVIVTRDGRFVTCLGQGMRQDNPVIPRPQIDALLAKVEDKRARREIAQRELRPDEEEGDLFYRVLHRGYRFAREDFVALSAFEAMLGSTPYVVMLDMALEAVKLRAAMAHGIHKVVVKSTSRPAFEKLDRLEWSVAHLTLLSGAGERFSLDDIVGRSLNKLGSPTFPCSVQQGSTYFLRSAWLAARLGKTAIPAYKSALANLADWMALLDAALGLGAIALRHGGTLGEVRRILQTYAPGDKEPLVDPAKDGSNAAVRAVIAWAILKALDAPDEETEALFKIGRDFCVTAGSGLPDGHPLRFTEPDQVPADLVKAALLSFDGDIREGPVQQLVFACLSMAARAKPEEFYYPREVVRAWLGQWAPEEAYDRLKRFAEPKKEGVRAEPKPGRNDPCTCGSGKKWKKCHGGPAAEPGNPAS